MRNFLKRKSVRPDVTSDYNFGRHTHTHTHTVTRKHTNAAHTHTWPARTNFLSCQAGCKPSHKRARTHRRKGLFEIFELARCDWNFLVCPLTQSTVASQIVAKVWPGSEYQYSCPYVYQKVSVHMLVTVCVCLIVHVARFSWSSRHNSNFRLISYYDCASRLLFAKMKNFLGKKYIGK